MDVFGWQMFLEVFRDCCRCQLPQTLMSVRCNARITRWWQLKHFWNFHPDPLGVSWANLTVAYFFQNGWEGKFSHQRLVSQHQPETGSLGESLGEHPPPFEHPPSEPYNQPIFLLLATCWWNNIPAPNDSVILSRNGWGKSSITPHDKYLHEWRNKKFYCSLPKVKGLPVWNPQGQCVKWKLTSMIFQ